MASFVDFFYPLPARRRTAGAVFQWWEERRVAYNLIVGAAGCATIALTTLLLAVPGNFGGGNPPFVLILGGAVVYGVLANFCYFLGPLTELAMYRLWGDEAPRVGPALYRQGLIFSVGLTLFPTVLAGLGLIVRIFARLLS
jgi:hypothetical protein